MDEDRRFKIKEVKKYESNIHGENAGIYVSILLAGLMALTSFVMKDKSLNYYNEIQNALTDSSLRSYYGSLIGEVLSNVGIALNSANLMISLNEKRKLQNKIDEIKEELGPLYDLYEQEYDEEESKGRGR